MKISVVINCDTRTGFQYEITKEEGMFNGCISNDFLISGVENKIKFFEGFDIEVILFVDEHIKVPTETYERMSVLADTLVIRKHTTEPLFNDNNYLKALSLASGDYIAHFDQDTAAFRSKIEVVSGIIGLLERFDYVSYPSYWSPNPTHDDSFDYWWASTRFFMCKRETIDFAEIKWMMADYDRCYEKYPASRRVFWTEHFLGLLAKYKGKGVLYPPMELDLYTIFSWGSYRKGILQKLNNMTYDEVVKYIKACGNIHYPADIDCIEI